MDTRSFFGENGITSTSASHIANLAKEAVRNVYAKLQSARFYTETVGLLTSDRQATVKTGWDEKILDSLPGLLQAVSQANSLIAFLREAIKEKEKAANDVNLYMDVESRERINKEFADLRLFKPIKPSYPTEESVMQSWSIGEQEKYLSLEAEAAALGKFIHEDGYFSKARIDLMNKIQNPSKVDVNGSETVVYNYIPTVDIEEVDEMFNEFQSHYREVQAELNGMKKRIEDTIQSERLRIDSEYADAKRKYDLQEKVLSDELAAVEREEDIKKQEMLREVQNLKIVIPNRLKPIYDALKR